MLSWLRRFLRRLQRRWIADAAERDQHEAIVRERLVQPPPDDRPGR
ncbi:MAG: hypothetical protein QOI85_1057 [Chloroflexota bacterium]|nr:hypothetical protein [Chloroflexota bacterium]